MPDPHLPESELKPVIDEPPPFLGTWNRVYAVVLCYIAVVILLFYMFSKAFAA